MSRLTDPSPQPTPPSNNRRWHLWIVLAIVAISSLGLVPHALFYLHHGRGPLSSAQVRDIGKCKGLTRDEVRSLLGAPHDDCFAGQWIYFSDVLGVGMHIVSFGEDDLVDEIR